MHVRLCIVLCLATLLAGCVSAVRGEPIASPEPAKVRNAGPLSARAALGDLRTVDYCSLVEEFDLPEGMGVFRDAPAPRVRFCWFSMIEGGPELNAQVGHLEIGNHRRPGGRTLEGGLRVVPGEESATVCERFVVFADALSLMVRTFWEDHDGLPVAKRPKALCELSDAVTAEVTASLVAGRARAMADLDRESLLRRDMCTVVSRHVLRKSGVPIGIARRYPDGHDCTWYDEDGQFLGGVFLDSTDVPEYDYDYRGEPISVAERRSVLERPVGPDAVPSCMITTAHADFPDYYRKWEEITVQVVGERRESCRTAKRIAAQVWPKLPKPG